MFSIKDMGWHAIIMFNNKTNNLCKFDKDIRRTIFEIFVNIENF